MNQGASHLWPPSLPAKKLKRTREHDQNDYPIPVVSYYHPEQAGLWEPNLPIQATEAWMGAR